jgi:hypothetical protein
MPSTFPRRRFIVDLRFQAPFLVKVALIWAGGTILLCALLYYLADEELGRNFYSIHQRIRTTWQLLLPAVLLSGAISFLVTIAVTLLFALRESHRIGGPVHKFRLLFRELEGGSVDPTFRFRKGDFLIPLGEVYRDALDAHGRRIRAAREEVAAACEAVDLLSSLLDGRQAGAEEREAVEAAGRRLGEARRRLSEFRLAPPNP